MLSPLRQEGFAKASVRIRMILPCDYVIVISKAREPPNQNIPQPQNLYVLAEHFFNIHKSRSSAKTENR